MNLFLIRNAFLESGIFGEIKNDKQEHLFFTLEHAFLQKDGSYSPKTAPGNYNCRNDTGPLHGLHSLKNGVPFKAFEIENVPPFEGIPVSGILFHIGNWNQDSEGCVLLGKAIGNMNNGGLMLTNSGIAFGEFMDILNQVDEFNLTVENI